jgi:alkanesulfonate monooxygenase SsuD/methylene tetrahydromethanopterin reductase-like flavin-dependent oxidoreductase (luciferase family)
MIAYHATRASAGGETAARHIAAAVGFVADTTEQAAAELKDAMPRWLRPGLAGYVPVDGRARRAADVEAYVDMLCRIHPVGSPEHCARKILRTATRTGVRRLILLVEGAGEHRRTLENVARLGSQVLPLLRREK